MYERKIGIDIINFYELMEFLEYEAYKWKRITIITIVKYNFLVINKKNVEMWIVYKPIKI